MADLEIIEGSDLAIALRKVEHTGDASKYILTDGEGIEHRIIISNVQKMVEGNELMLVSRAIASIAREQRNG